jgi:hypothetical protein
MGTVSPRPRPPVPAPVTVPCEYCRCMVAPAPLCSQCGAPIRARVVAPATFCTMPDFGSKVR